MTLSGMGKTKRIRLFFYLYKCHHSKWQAASKYETNITRAQIQQVFSHMASLFFFFYKHFPETLQPFTNDPHRYRLLCITSIKIFKGNLKYHAQIL